MQLWPVFCVNIMEFYLVSLRSVQHIFLHGSRPSFPI